MKYTESPTFQDKMQLKYNGRLEKEDIPAYYENVKELDGIEKKITDVLEVLRSTYNIPETIDILVHSLAMEHRTHQQSIIAKLYYALKEYGKFDTDLRNENAVGWAKDATKDENFFPFI